MAHTIVGFFENLADADLAVTELTSLGLGEEHIVLVAESDFEGSEYGHLRTKEPLGVSFRGAGMSDAEAEIFAQGISQGGIVLMVVAKDEQVDEVGRIMIARGAVDLDKGLPEPRPSTVSHKEPAALPFDPHKKPLRERVGGVKQYVHVE